MGWVDAQVQDTFAASNQAAFGSLIISPKVVGSGNSVKADVSQTQTPSQAITQTPTLAKGDLSAGLFAPGSTNPDATALAGEVLAGNAAAAATSSAGQTTLVAWIVGGVVAAGLGILLIFRLRR